MIEFIRLPNYTSYRAKVLLISNDDPMIQPILEKMAEFQDAPMRMCDFLEDFIRGRAIGAPKDIHVCGISSSMDSFAICVRVMSSTFERVEAYGRLPEWRAEFVELLPDASK